MITIKRSAATFAAVNNVCILVAHFILTQFIHPKKPGDNLTHWSANANVHTLAINNSTNRHKRSPEAELQESVDADLLETMAARCKRPL